MDNRVCTLGENDYFVRINAHHTNGIRNNSQVVIWTIKSHDDSRKGDMPKHNIHKTMLIYSKYGNISLKNIQSLQDSIQRTPTQNVFRVWSRSK